MKSMLSGTPIKILFIATALSLAMYSCQKESDGGDASITPEECVTGQSTTQRAAIPNQYIVAYNGAVINGRTLPSEKISERSAQLLRTHSIRESALKDVFRGEPGGFLATLTDEEAQKLKSDPAIAFVERDRFIALGACFTVVEPRLITWNVKRVGYGDGTGKTAWIIDSGIDFDHPDLNVDRVRSKSFIANVSSADDENGHGTHVAGIIGGKNNSTGVLGVASGASLVSLRVLDEDGNGKLSSIIQALGYVNSAAKAGDVVNMSFGEDTISQILDQNVKNTAARGIYIAIAAGNDGQPAMNFSPSRVNGTNIYTVSAVDSLDRFATFSNFGNEAVDFAAPGVHILSTYLNGQYAIMSGTSMAAPHVAGLLLLKGTNFTSSGAAKNDPDGTPDPIAHY